MMLIFFCPKLNGVHALFLKYCQCKQVYIILNKCPKLNDVDDFMMHALFLKYFCPKLNDDYRPLLTT